MFLKQTGKMIFGKTHVIGHFFQSQILADMGVNVGQQAGEFLVVLIVLFRGRIGAGGHGLVVIPSQGGQDVD